MLLSRAAEGWSRRRVLVGDAGNAGIQQTTGEVIKASPYEAMVSQSEQIYDSSNDLQGPRFGGFLL